MQNKSRVRHLLRYPVIALVILTLAMLIECLIFQFPALRYKQQPVSFACDGTDARVQLTQQEALAKLSEDEVKSIEVERDNNRILAEYKGEEYVEEVDESLVEQEGELYRRVMKTIISIDFGKDYYIHKLDLRAPVTSSSGYNTTVYRSGQPVNADIYCSIEPKTGAGISNVSEKADSVRIEILSADELSPAEIKIQISNNFRPNAMRLFWMLVLFSMTAVLILETQLLKEKPEWIFAISCFLLGSLLICGIGTNQISYDEYVHAKAAYKLSFGTTIESTESAIQMSGNLLPFFNNPEERALVEAYEDVNNDYSWADIGHQSRFVRSETRVYYPMAIGFKLGRMLHASFAQTVQLAKFGNLLFYILIVFFAIRLAKNYKSIVVLIGLLPNCIFLASALTYDAVVNSFLLLGMVLILNEILQPDRKITWQSTLGILLSFAIGCQSKPIYIVMALLLLFFGKNKFENRIQEWIFKAAVLVMAGLMLYNIFFPTPAAGSDYYLVGNFDFAGDKRNLGTSVTGQIAYILSNPLTYTLLLLSSMFSMTANYLTGGADFFQYGYLGTAPTITSIAVLLLAIWLMLYSAKLEKREGIGARYIVLHLIMILGTAAIVWTSMYVSYTTVGADSISGVQGRYFIPLFLPFLACFMNARLQSRLGQVGRRRIVFAVMTGLNLLMIYALVIQKMNV